jgi:hypothetical protein
MNEEWEDGLKTKKYHFVQQCGIKSPGAVLKALHFNLNLQIGLNN